MSCCFEFLFGSSNSPPQLEFSSKAPAPPFASSSPPATSNEAPPVVTYVPPPKEPEPEVPEVIPDTPITRDVMLGEWVSSHGAKVSFDGSDIIKMNTVPLKAHPIQFEGDLVVAIGTLWQVKGWIGVDKLEFIEAPSRDRMEGARSVVFTRVNAQTLKAHQDHLNSLGYKGSASNPMNRGIEGCGRKNKNLKFCKFI